MRYKNYQIARCTSSIRTDAQVEYRKNGWTDKAKGSRKRLANDEIEFQTDESDDSSGIFGSEEGDFDDID